MRTSSRLYIWQKSGWPDYRFDADVLAAPLAEAHRAQDRLAGKMETLGFDLRQQASAKVLTSEILKTSDIEGEKLSPRSVRSSVGRRLGIETGALPAEDVRTAGIVEVVLDAVQNRQEPLTSERLCRWHVKLMHGVLNALLITRIGQWRDDASGPMVIVSGYAGREKVHYQAVPADRLEKEMVTFLEWFNDPGECPDLLLKAGLAHLWFVNIHPFQDGNGRIARALGEMLLARSEGSGQRFYSLSTQIRRERKDYYRILERTGKGGMDVTGWMRWYLGCLARAIEGAHDLVGSVMAKARFWLRFAGAPMNERQLKMLNTALDGELVGKLTTRRWGKMCKCSDDTALRDIRQLVGLGALAQSEAGGRSTSYDLVIPD